jgi:hypothetical protein
MYQIGRNLWGVKVPKGRKARPFILGYGRGRLLPASREALASRRDGHAVTPSHGTPNVKGARLWGRIYGVMTPKFFQKKDV